MLPFSLRLRPGPKVRYPYTGCGYPIQIPAGIWNSNSNLRLVEFQIPAWFWCTSKPPVIVYAVYMILLVSDILYMPCILYMPYISDILYMPYISDIPYISDTLYMPDISDIPYFEMLQMVHARTRTSSKPNHIWNLNLEFGSGIWNLNSILAVRPQPVLSALFSNTSLGTPLWATSFRAT